MKRLTITSLILASFSLSACAVTTAGVTKGDERNFVRSLDDISADRVINARLMREADFDFSDVDIEVAQGVALLTGSVRTEEERLEAEQIALSAPNIVKVGNELHVKDKPDFGQSARDTFISTNLRAKLTTDKTVKARNVNTEVREGVVYLLGVARTPEELERTAEIASNINGVREVISYMTLPNATFQSARFDAPAAPVSQRPLPEALSLTPEGGDIPYSPPSMTTPDNSSIAGASEPYYRDPVTGERITLPPGTETVPYNPQLHGPIGQAAGKDAPYYINQDTGEKVMIVYRQTIR